MALRLQSANGTVESVSFNVYDRCIYITSRIDPLPMYAYYYTTFAVTMNHSFKRQPGEKFSIIAHYNRNIFH